MHELSSLLWQCRFDPLGLSDPEGAGGFVNPEWLRCVHSCSRPDCSQLFLVAACHCSQWLLSVPLL